MANPDLAPGALMKPDRFDRDLAKFEKRRAKDRAKRALKVEENAAWKALSWKVFNRDGGCCRICGRALKFNCDDPREDADAHHIIFRSAGGPNETWNLITVCAFPCHRQIHRRMPNLWLEVEGNGDEEVSIQSINPETGRVIRQWESRLMGVSTIRGSL